MDVFFTSTGQGSLGSKSMKIYYPMNETLSERLGDYGDGLSQWFLMFMILDRESPERIMWKKKSKELDLRLNVDFEAFNRGSTDVRRTLLVQTMRRSLDIIADKKIADFDIDALKADFEEIVSSEGWET